jgi:hypothetical protein
MVSMYDNILEKLRKLLHVRKDTWDDLQAVATLIGAIYTIVSTIVYLKRHHDEVKEQALAGTRLIARWYAWFKNRKES